jgi:dTDP-4-amino-4,6-dideoxygalactose transaminase
MTAEALSKQPGQQPAIPFNLAMPQGREREYVQDSISSGHTSASGPFSRRAGEILKQETGAAEVLLTTSCTSALEMTAMLLDLQPGDTVVVPSFTFTSTALAYARQGARLIFCDIEPTTLGIDTDHLASLLDDSVRAVVPVHYAGVACDVAGLRRALADRPDVAVIEDNAHGLFGSWHGEPLGSLGSFATQSFHETKNISCGEGGALLVNDPQYVDRARVLYDKGTNRQAFFLGQVDKYSWKDTGSSFGLSDMLAAYLVGQLEERDKIQTRRREIYEHYQRLLEPAVELGCRLPVIPEGSESAYHMFYVLLPDRERRNAVLERMQQQGVKATFHYVPLHSSDAGQRFAARTNDCPVTDDISGRLLRLPFYNSLAPEQVERVAATFLDALRTTA